MAAVINNEEENNAIRGEHQERYNELEKEIGGQEIRIQNLQNSAFQLANYFFVFQGVVVATISNNSSFTCSDAWFVFSLSLVAATLNLFALFSIASKYVRAMDLHEQTWSDYNLAAGLVHHNYQNRRHGFTGEHKSPSPGDTVVQSGGTKNNNNRDWSDHFGQRRRYVVLAVCMVLFLAFTAITLAGPWLITCKRDRRLRENRRSSPGSDCFRVCDDETSTCMFLCKDIV